MAFMRAYCEPFDGWIVDTNMGTDHVRLDYSPDPPTLNSSFLEPGVTEVYEAELVRGWWEFGISAPGYLDQSSLGVFETRAEGARACLDAFFDHETLDDEEQEDVKWLEDLASQRSR